MKLEALRTNLKIITGTNIGEVIFDWQEFLNTDRSKTYPIVLWSLDNASFKKDLRRDIVQKEKTLSLKVFAIDSFDVGSQDKLDVWDTLENDLDAYLNIVNSNTSIAINDINEIKGEYFPDGIFSPDREIGIGYDLTLTLYCNWMSAMTLISGLNRYRKGIDQTTGQYMIEYSDNDGVTWVTIGYLDPSEDSVIIDSINQYRHRIVGTSYHIDRKLTALGYSGTEDIDWENIYST